MTNKYLAKLHGLESGTGADIFKTRDPQEPSKPSKPSFEDFEGDQGWRISKNSSDRRTVEPCGNSTAQNEKRGTLANPQNLQNLRSPSVPGDGRRVIIVELPAVGLRYRRTFAHLQLRPPDHVPESRWQMAILDARAFLHQRGDQAQALGWDSRDLFGLHTPPANPHPSYQRLSRYDATGLIWLLQNRAVVALTADTATIRNPATGSVTVYRRLDKPGAWAVGRFIGGFEMTVQTHPLADIFPLIDGAEFDELVADIKAHGLHEPIVLFEDKVLDGRNRLRACEAAGAACRFETYTGDDPVAYVVSLNLRRRHLDESQRAMVAAKLATLRDGQRADLVEGLPIGRASALLNVGERSVARAREVIDCGAPELRQAVERGGVSVSAAADVATLPEQEQREIVARGEREILRAAQQIRARKAEVRRTERIERLAATCNQNTPFPSDRRCAVVYADPPWHFEVYNEESGIERAAGNHYPTMEMAEICALPVADIATDDAILFMWTTAPHLQQSFQVLAAWGFEYKSNAVWVKDKLGLGYYVRNRHELLLIATRGDFPCPQPANRPPSVIQAPRREHSRKPDEAYALIEAMYPELPKIELFARQTRPGWAAWGNELACAAAE